MFKVLGEELISWEYFRIAYIEDKSLSCCCGEYTHICAVGDVCSESG
jgi:hypothetical protein